MTGAGFHLLQNWPAINTGTVLLRVNQMLIKSTSAGMPARVIYLQNYVKYDKIKLNNKDVINKQQV